MEHTFKQINFKTLEEGDIIRHKSGGEAYIVTGNYGDRAIAVRTIDITNEREWEVLKKVT